MAAPTSDTATAAITTAAATTTVTAIAASATATTRTGDSGNVGRAAAVAPSTVLSDAPIREFDRNGCLIGGLVIDDENVDQLNRELDRVIATHGGAGPSPSRSSADDDKNARKPVMISKWGDAP